jgi:hypothetical protein
MNRSASDLARELLRRTKWSVTNRNTLEEVLAGRAEPAPALDSLSKELRVLLAK